jgi:two-component system KDP operon response regulator KdpE
MNNAEILVIDDEVQIQKLLEITLLSNDYGVRKAVTARQGLALAATHPPDMVLLDLGLPDENGHEVLKKLREWYNKPVIILSVQGGEEDIVKALDNGANDYLVKPFRTGELLARIRSALRSTTLDQENPILDCN